MTGPGTNAGNRPGLPRGNKRARVSGKENSTFNIAGCDDLDSEDDATMQDQEYSPINMKRSRDVSLAHGIPQATQAAMPAPAPSKSAKQPKQKLWPTTAPMTTLPHHSPTLEPRTQTEQLKAMIEQCDDKALKDKMLATLSTYSSWHPTFSKMLRSELEEAETTQSKVQEEIDNVTAEKAKKQLEKDELNKSIKELDEKLKKAESAKQQTVRKTNKKLAGKIDAFEEKVKQVQW